jgi:hypothetical protein
MLNIHTKNCKKAFQEGGYFQKKSPPVTRRRAAVNRNLCHAYSLDHMTLKADILALRVFWANFWYPMHTRISDSDILIRILKFMFRVSNLCFGIGTYLGKVFEILSRNGFHGMKLVLSCSGGTIYRIIIGWHFLNKTWNLNFTLESLIWEIGQNQYFFGFFQRILT